MALLNRFRVWHERRERRRLARARRDAYRAALKCPTCRTTSVVNIGGSIWGFVEYQCKNGHRFDVDVL